MRPLGLERFDRGLRCPPIGWLAGAVVFARWTWITLWRVGSGPKEQVVYDHGVRTIGPMLCAVLVVGVGFSRAISDRLSGGLRMRGCQS